MKKTFCLLLLLASVHWLSAQHVVKGVVLDKSTGESLIGVSIYNPATGAGTVTDVDGYFDLNVGQAEATLQFSYVGYITREIKVIANQTNLGKIEMESDAIGLQDVTITSSVAIQRKTPVAVSTVTGLEIEERLGSQEFPEILKTTPGIHVNRQGGGFGDSEAYMRGFDNTNIAVMVNGVPMNDMENGNVYWSNWAGLNDVTATMQAQRGLGASKVSAPSVGGTINIITKGIDSKRGGSVQYALGNDGYNKIAFSVSSGMTDNGWAFTVLGSRTWGNGYVQGTDFEGYNYFVNIAKRLGESHQLSLTAFGAPQKHYQRDGALTMAGWEEVAKYMADGKSKYRYNASYGFDQNGQRKTAEYNEYHKPQISLNHTWQIDHKSSLATALYTSIGRGNGYSGQGNDEFSNYSYQSWYGARYGELNKTFRKADGTFDYGAIYDINSASNYGSMLVMSKSKNYHNWYGLLSTYTNKFAEYIDFYAGLDLRYYKGTHTNEIVDLYGGDYYMDPERGGVSVENNIAAADKAWRYQKLGVGDVVYRDYDGYVMQEGVFTQAEYNRESFNIFLAGSISYTNYWRYDRFYYDAEHARSETVGFLGGTVKTGANYNINKYNNIFLNVGYISRAPKFAYGAFMQSTTSNAINVNAKNEQVMSAEIGYGFHNSWLSANLNAYFTEWMDKTMTKSGTLENQEEYYMNMTGVNARHMGVELDIKAEPTQWMEITAMFSWGDWTWDSDSVVGYAYDAHGQALRPDGTITTPGAPDQAYAIINMKGIQVGGSAQTTAALGMTFKPMKGLRVGGEYVLYDRNYAYYSLSGSNLSLGKTVNVLAPWKIPTGGQLDLRASYRFQMGKLDAVISGNVNNVLDQFYIEKAYNPSSIVSGSVTEANLDNVYMYFSTGRTYSIRLKINF